MTIQLKDLADELGVSVSDVKHFLRDAGYATPSRDFRGSATTLTSEEGRAVRAAHAGGVLRAKRRRDAQVAAPRATPDPEVSSADLAALSPVAPTPHAVAVPRDGAAHAVYLHQDLLAWLGDPASPEALRKVVTRRIQELMAHGRVGRAKGVRGKNRGWVRTPAGGTGGSQFYLWLSNQGEPIGGQEDRTHALHASGEQGARYLRTVRHHDATRNLLDVGDPSDYARVRASEVLYASADGLADPLLPAQRGFVGDRTRVRVLVGRPGAGKTTALEAAISTLEGRALYVTWSEHLVRRAREWLDAFAPRKLELEVWTFRELVARLDPSRPIVEEPPLTASIAALARRLERVSPRLDPWRRGGRVRADALHAELHAHLIGAALPVSFRGRRAATDPWLSSEDYAGLREELGREAIEAALRARERLGPGGVRELFPGPAAAFELARDLQAGRLTVPASLSFDWVIVDEAQDLTLVELWLLIDAVARGGRARGVKPGLLVAGDESQTVRPTAFAFGPLNDLLTGRLDAQLEKQTHELLENLRSPEAIATLVDRCDTTLYGLLRRSQRPRGRRAEGLADVTVGRVAEIHGGDDETLDRVLRSFAALPGEAAVVCAGAVVPEPVRRLAAEAGVVVWTSETAKGLEFRVVGVLDFPGEVQRVEKLAQEASTDPLAAELARSAIDRLLVALSRSTETLVLAGAGWAAESPALRAIMAAESVVPEDESPDGGDGDARDGHLGEVSVADLADLLHVDAPDALTQIEAILDQSERLTETGEHEDAVRLAENAKGRLGRKGVPGAAGPDLRRRTHLRHARALARSALAPDPANATRLRQAGRAFGQAGATDARAVVAALAVVLEGAFEDTITCERFLGAATGLPGLQEAEPWLATAAARHLAARVFSFAQGASVPAQPRGRLALLDALERLEAEAPGARDAFARAHRDLLIRILEHVGGRADKPHRAEYDRLRSRVTDPPLLARLDARHAEACGELSDAMRLWEETGSPQDALRCARAMPDLDAAERLARGAGFPDAALVAWARELAEHLGRRPAGELTDAEAAHLLDLLARAVGAPPASPRPART